MQEIRDFALYPNAYGNEIWHSHNSKCEVHVFCSVTVCSLINGLLQNVGPYLLNYMCYIAEDLSLHLC
jgi:hypothetical protein